MCREYARWGHVTGVDAEDTKLGPVRIWKHNDSRKVSLLGSLTSFSLIASSSLTYWCIPKKIELSHLKVFEKSVAWCLRYVYGMSQLVLHGLPHGWGTRWIFKFASQLGRHFFCVTLEAWNRYSRLCPVYPRPAALPTFKMLRKAKWNSWCLNNQLDVF